MNEAISTIALGVDTELGKEHLANLRLSFAALKKELLEINQLRLDPNALAGDASKSNSALATLSAELRKAREQIVSLQGEFAALSKGQVDSAQKTAQAVKDAAVTGAKARIENERAAAAEIEKIAKNTTRTLEEEQRKRYSKGQSAKSDGIMYSARESGSESEFTAALAASEKLRREILSNSVTMIIAEAERAEQRRREVLINSHAMIIAETERAEARRREITANSQVMMMADTDRHEALRREKSAVSQIMLMADVDRADALRTEKTANARAIRMADIDREEQRRLEILRNSQTMQMADIDRANQLRLEKLKVSNDMLIAETERAEARKQAILNNNFNTGSMRAQVTTLSRAKGLVDQGDHRLAADLYGSEAVASVSKLSGLEAALANNMTKGNAVKKEATAQTHAYRAALDDAHSAARGMAGGLGQLWMTWGSVVPLVAGAAVTGSMVKVYTVGKDIEYQLQFLRALATDMEKQPIDFDRFLKVTDGSLTSLKDAAEGMRALAQSGLNQQQALAALPEVLNLAAIGEMKVGQAALAATGILNAFGMEVDQIGRVGDIFARIAASSNTSVQGMTESMKQASTVGEQFKVSIEETSASIGVLAQRNIVGSSAGTSLTNALKNLYEPTDKAARVLKQLNIDTTDGYGGMKNYTQLLSELSQKLSTYDASSKAVILGTLTDQRGAKTLSAITENMGRYTEFLNQARASAGFMSKAVLEMEDTVEAGSRRMANSLEGSFLLAFKNASPVIRQVQDDLAAMGKSEEVISALTRLSIAAARLTMDVTENARVIGGAVAVYMGLRIVSSLSNSFLVWRTAQAQATAATLANTLATEGQAVALTRVGVAAEVAAAGGLARFAAGARLAVAAMGPFSLIIMAAYTAYELYNASISKGDAEQMKVNNTANITLDYYQRQIDKLTELNRQLDETGNSATTAANKTVRAQLEAQRLLAQTDVERLEKSQPKQATTRLKTLGGTVDVARGIAPSNQDLQDARKRLDKIDNQITALGQAEVKVDFLSQRNKQLSGKKEVESRIDNLIKTAGGSMWGGGNADSKKLVPTLEGLKDKLKEDADAYLGVAPKIADIEKQINKSLAHYDRPDKRRDNDVYKSRQLELDGRLQAIKDGERSSLNEVKTQQRTNEIGELQAVAKNLEIVKKARADELDVFTQKERLAAQTENRRADEQGITNRKEHNARLDVEAESEADRASREIMYKWQQDNLKVEADTLRKRGELVNAYLAEYGAKFAESIKSIEKDLAVPGISDEKQAALESRRKYLLDQRSAGIDTNSFEEAKREYDDLIAHMEERIAGVQAKASQTNGFLSDIGAVQMADAIRDKTLPAANALLEKMQTLADSTGDKQLSASVSKMGRDLIKEAHRSTDAWIAAGRSIETSLSSAFGKGGKAAGGMISAMIKQQEQQKSINAELARSKAGTDDPIKQAQAEVKAREESAQVQLSTYADLTGAAKNFFDQQSGGYKALQTAEQVFRAFEMAKAAESFIMKTFFSQTEAQVFAGAELQKAIAADASAASIITAAVAEGQASAVAGVAAQAQGDPYSAWVRMAMMAATMAALGFAVSGGGGGGSKVDVAKERQKYAGTGMTKDTAFDWELQKSESLGRSLEVLANNSDIALEHSSRMLTALRSINDGISGMTQFVLQATGVRGTKMDEQALGIGSSKGFLSFSKSSKELVDSGILIEKVITAADNLLNIATGAYDGKAPVKNSDQTVGGVMSSGLAAKSYADVHAESSSFWGLSKSSSSYGVHGELDRDLKDQLALTVAGLYSGILEAAKTLGKDSPAMSSSLQSMSMKASGLDYISLKGLSGAEIETQLKAVFGKLGDDMARVALPGLEKFQKAGEGYMTTMIRVASGTDLATFELEKLGITTLKYTDIANKQGDVAAELIRSSLMAKEGLNGVSGMIETMSGSAQDLVDAYGKLVSVRQTLTDTGISGEGLTRVMVRAAGGLDSLQGGTKAFYDRFFSDDEKRANSIKHLGAEFTKLGLTMPTTMEGYRALVLSIGTSTDETQKLTGKLLALSDTFADTTESTKAATNKRLSLEADLMELLGKKSEALAQRRRLELESMDASLRPLQSHIWALSDAKDVLESSFSDYQSELEKTIDKFKDFGKALREFRDELLTGSLSNMAPEAKYAESKSQFERTYDLARSGDQDAVGRMKDVSQKFLEASRDYFASSQGYTTDFDRVRSALDNTALAADTQVSIAQAALEQAKRQVQGIIEVKNSIDSAANRFEVALAQYAAAAASARMPTPAAGGGSGPSAGGATQQPNLAGANAQFVESMYGSMLGRTSDAPGLAHFVEMLDKGATPNDIMADIARSQEYRSRVGYAKGGVFTNGIVSQPTLFNVAEMGEKDPEAIVPLVRTPHGLGVRSVGGGSDEETKELLRQVIAQLQASVALSQGVGQGTLNSLSALSDRMEEVSRAVRATT